MKKITFIYPAIGKKPGKKYIKTWKMEPLPIATLASFTPADIEIEFFDDRLELINYESQTELVAITVETYTSKRAYSIAAKFRARGIPVVLGGYHPTHLPEESGKHADAVLVGNAESQWTQILKDAGAGKLQKTYMGEYKYSSVLPDRRIFKGKNYLNLGLVETGRGCQFDCEFCHITTFYKGKYYPRPVQDVVADVQRSGKKNFFFVDDNLVANPDYALELCKAIAPLNISWASQGTLTIATNQELLHWMRKSGCMVLLIGFESLEEQNLRQMGKAWNLNLGKLQNLVKQIHDAGIGIYGTFLFGFDYDTEDTFKKTLDFSLESKFFYTAFNHLLPFPQTPLYHRLKKSNRLSIPEWWLSDDYKYGDVVFQPKNMSAEELSGRCVETRNEFFKFSSIWRRGFEQLKRNPSPTLFGTFLFSNMKLKEEVGGKLALPLGKGLDELPK